jgi:hypothetical protein
MRGSFEVSGRVQAPASIPRRRGLLPKQTHLLEVKAALCTDRPEAECILHEQRQLIVHQRAVTSVELDNLRNIGASGAPYHKLRSPGCTIRQIARRRGQNTPVEEEA